MDTSIVRSGLGRIVWHLTTLSISRLTIESHQSVRGRNTPCVRLKTNYKSPRLRSVLTVSVLLWYSDISLNDTSEHGLNRECARQSPLSIKAGTCCTADEQSPAHEKVLYRISRWEACKREWSARIYYICAWTDGKIFPKTEI